jgi:TRAP-type mannitol/chloroaromatic compound transport system substrate-binding protein
MFRQAEKNAAYVTTPANFSSPQTEEEVNMKRKSLFVRMFFVTLVVFALGVWNVFSVSNTEAQTILKFSHTDQEQGARQGAAVVFAKKVEQYTNGRYKVQVYCCSQLGNDPKNRILCTAFGLVESHHAAVYRGQL